VAVGRNCGAKNWAPGIAVVAGVVEGRRLLGRERAVVVGVGSIVPVRFGLVVMRREVVRSVAELDRGLDMLYARDRESLPPLPAPFPGGAERELANGMSREAKVLTRIVLRHGNNVELSK
jgi:hypothetical protein